MTDQRSDQELARLMVEYGDEAAFRALYRRHAPRVYQFVLRLLGGNQADADDVTQEAWLRAARALDRFRWDSALSSWLSGIALNCAREWARKRGRAPVEVGGEWEMPAPERDPTGGIDLERALELLPSGFRTVIVLYDVEGFTHEQIGERLGISDGDVRMPDLHSIARSDLSDIAADQLREMILTGAISPGSRLVEKDLAAALGISRTPVREALSRLRVDGLVVSAEGRGLVVAPLSAAEVWEVYPVLAALERFALDQSPPPTPEALEELKLLNGRLMEAGDGASRLALDSQWHGLLLAGCRNRLVIELLRPLKLRVRQYETLYMDSLDRLDDSHREHRVILDHLQDGAVGEAAARLEEHWIRSMRPLIAALQSTDEGGQCPEHRPASL